MVDECLRIVFEASSSFSTFRPSGARVNNRPDVLATERGGEAARHESVHDLHVLDVARGRHDLQERAVERQRALMLRELSGAGLTEQLRLFSVGSLGIGGVHPIDVLHDREAGRAERIGEQKRSCVGPVRGDA
jgi:hypothetical protein